MPNALQFQATHLHKLFEVLHKFGYQIIGPTVADGAIIYDEITTVGQLPIGWTDEQSPGNYRLKKRKDRAYFGFTVGPYSWKKFLFPPYRRMWQAKKAGKGIQVLEEKPPKMKLAFLGVRSCELHAIKIQDQVFLEGEYIDPYYQAVRRNALVIGINCGTASGTCFCVSMNTGPTCQSGYDLVLTEDLEGEHRFFIDSGSANGEKILKSLPFADKAKNYEATVARIANQASRSMGRSLETDGIKDLLFDNLNHPRWAEVANRCLSCANCTMACPTCFCSTVEEVTDLTLEHAERWKKWDSCFTTEFSYVHGGAVRNSTLSKYRQWMTHKLASWQDQFGVSGCVGCGRCLTWCPVGIDITEEAKHIREDKPKGAIHGP